MHHDEYDLRVECDRFFVASALDPDEAIKIGIISTFSDVSRLFTAIDNAEKNSAVVFHFKGICASRRSDFHAQHPRQLLLCAANGPSSSLYRRLFRRCLSTIQISLGTHYALPKSFLCELSAPEYNSKLHIEKLDAVLVPGGGAAEMMWSVLWEFVSTQLLSPALVSIYDVDTCSEPALFLLGNWMAFHIAKSVTVEYFGSRCSDFDSDAYNHDILTCDQSAQPPNICSLCSHIVHYLILGCHNLQKDLLDCKYMCNMLSKAYEVIPQQLLRNLFHQLLEPIRCKPDEPALIMMRQMYKTKNEVKGIISGRSLRSEM